MRKPRPLFVFAITGDSQVPRLNQSLRFLKPFTQNDIVVVACRCRSVIHHDQVLRQTMSENLDDHRASILLKTDLYRVIGSPSRPCCYLDSDVVAVDGGVDRIFHQRTGVVTFAADHVRLRRFSRYAVHCPCVRGDCDHLREAIRQKFGVEVTDPDWQHWNGGVFLFDGESSDFLATWHAYTRAIFEDSYWKTRDQGTLIATVWKHNMQMQALLNSEFNHIVDANRAIRAPNTMTGPPAAWEADTSYSLDHTPGLPRPCFLHFINGGIGTTGWKNWDDAVARLSAGPCTADKRVAKIGSSGSEV